MGLMDRFRGNRGTLGIELGSTVAAAQVVGSDSPRLRASGQSGHAGLEGEAMGDWLEQWLDTIGSNATNAHAVVVDEDSYHYLVSMPQMDAKERHLAAGAEVRKLAPVPAGQLAYSHVAVGTVEEEGVTKDRVLIAAMDRGAVTRATDAVGAAGLDADVVTTVPMALAEAHDLLSDTAGGTAIAYLSAGRSYLLVFQDGTLELVRDFVLRSDDRDFDPQAMTELVIAELRRSFLYFGQRAQGAKVDRLVLAGPMANMTDVAARLREGLGISVELFDAASSVDLGSADPYDQPAIAVALGAARLDRSAGGSLIAPEDVSERQTRRAVSGGLWVAAVIALILLGLAAWALINSTLLQSRLDDAQTRLAARQAEMADAQGRARERGAHAARVQLLEQRALESTLIGAVMQRVSQRTPDQLALESLEFRPVTGPGGTAYWDVELNGLVFGATRSESQAIFNRFYALLESDPLVDSAHLTENLQIGDAGARTGREFQAPGAGAARAAGGRRGPSGGNGRIYGDDWPVVGRNPWLQLLPNNGQGMFGRSGVAGGRAGTTRGADGTPTEFTTTLDELPPFAPTATSVGFTIVLQLKAIAPGGNR